MTSYGVCGTVADINRRLLSYDNEGDSVEIGGSTCHLCGQPVKYKNTGGRRKKSGQWVEHVDITYTCGTNVFVSSKGNKTVSMGANCVQTG